MVTDQERLEMLSDLDTSSTVELTDDEVDFMESVFDHAEKHDRVMFSGTQRSRIDAILRKYEAFESFGQT